MEVHHHVDRYDRKLKIAVIVKSFPALSETFILNRITGLIKRGHMVDIFARRPRGSDKYVHKLVYDYNLLSKTKYESKSVEPVIFDKFRKFKILVSTLRKSNVLSFIEYFPKKKIISQLSRFSSREQFDVIHAFYGVNGLLALYARKLGILEGPIAVSFHGFDLSILTKKNPLIYDELFQEAELFLPVCEYYKEKLIKLGCPAEKILVHPSSIDVKKFAPAEKNNSLTNVNIISIGRLVEKKGFKFSIQAVAEYIKENPSKDITYRIFGTGKLNDELQILIDQLQISNHIDIRDSVNQAKIVSIIQDSDILICPSVVAENGDEDAIPNVLKEAMACELPVIASRHGAIRELVKHEENGFLVKEKDVQGLKKRIDNLVSSPKLRNKLGKNGREYVKKHYEIESRNDIISEVYKKLATRYSFSN